MRVSWLVLCVILMLFGCSAPTVGDEALQETSLSDGGSSVVDGGSEPSVSSEPSGKEQTGGGESGVEKPPVAEVSEEKPVVPESAQEPVTPGPELGPEPVQDAGTEPVPEKPVGPDSPPVTAADYTKDGPLGTKDLTTITLTAPSSTGCTGSLCTIRLYVTMPASGQGTRNAPYPLVILSNGFLLKADQYASYAKRLATWGYVAVRWDTNGENILSSLKHDALGKMIKFMIDWAAQENQKQGSVLQGQMQSNQVVLVGHSRGGKASALAAQADSRVVAFFGIDPVNSNPPGGSGPSALTGLAQMKAAVAVVGADKGGQGLQPCAPPNDNYEKFYNAAKSPAWELLLTDVGHMQFLDQRSSCLTCLVCPAGATADTVVREITQTALVAWAERFTRQVDITKYTTGSWIQALKQQGRLQSRTK